IHDLVQKDTEFFMRPEKGTIRILTRNCAVIVLMWLLLLGSTIVMFPGTSSVYAQQAEEGENRQQDRREALTNLRALLGGASGTNLQGVLGDVVAATDLDGLADAVGASDSSELTQNPEVTDSEGLGDLVEISDLDGLLQLVGRSDLRGLLDLLLGPGPPDGETPDTPETPDGETPDTPETPDGETPDTPETPDGETPDTPETPTDPPNQGGGEESFGIEQIYETAGGGPTWYIREREDPTSD